MSPLIRARRRAFTLVELLVVMSIIVLLSALTLLVVVNMGERDGTTDAAGLTRQWLMIAKNRAARDGAPRGLRLVTALDPNNPAKTSATWVTELQYIEAPPVLVPNPNMDVGGARVQFTYPLAPPPTGPSPPQPAQGSQLPPPTCQFINLTIADAQLIVRFSLLQLPTLGTWHRITNVGPPQVTSPGICNLTVTLDSYPDAPLGAAGVTLVNPGPTPPCYITHHFGVTQTPRPLMAEPPLQLPRNICIDVTPQIPLVLNQAFPIALAPSRPPAPTGVTGLFAAGDYDILFTPNGQVVPMGAMASQDGMIFLWHRDYTKLRNTPNGNYPLIVLNSVPGPVPMLTYDRYPFENGGVQQIVAIRSKTGALGQFDVLWPNAGGQYTGTDDPYTLSRFSATNP